MGKTVLLCKFLGTVSKIWRHIFQLLLYDNILASVSESNSLS